MRFYWVASYSLSSSGWLHNKKTIGKMRTIHNTENWPVYDSNYREKGTHHRVAGVLFLRMAMIRRTRPWC